MVQGILTFNPPVTARVKITQNVGILAMVYRVHFQVKPYV